MHCLFGSIERANHVFHSLLHQDHGETFLGYSDNPRKVRHLINDTNGESCYAGPNSDTGHSCLLMRSGQEAL